MILNRINKILNDNSPEGFKFRATNDYYQKIGIGKKMFGEFLRNKKQPTLSQLEMIAESIGVPPIDLIDGDLNKIPINNKKSLTI